MKCIFSIIILFFTLSNYAQEENLRLDGIQIEIDSLLKAYNTAGLSIAIVENNKVLYSNGFGYRNIKEKLPVNENSLFPIGSMTKQFTAALIGIYEGQNKLSISDKPKNYIKDLQFFTDEMNNLVTIKDLLAHRSGIGVVDGTHVFFPVNDINKHLERLPHLKPNSNVRERFDYSNMGYAILGKIGEEVTNRTWEENIMQDLFIPLEMYESNTSLKGLKNNTNHSLGYSIKDDRVIEVLYEDQHESAASGAINSSVYDLTKWMHMLLNQGVYNGKQVIPKKYIESSFSEQVSIRGSFSFEKKYNLLFDSYGYGWFVHSFKNLYKVNHGGNVSGFTSSIDLFPHHKVGIVILTNQGSTAINKDIVDIITNRIFKLKNKKWDAYEVGVGEATSFKDSIKSINENKKPSHPLVEFLGKYNNKGYGTLKINLENNNLVVVFPAFKMGLAHQHYNTFINKPIVEIHQNTPSFPFNFQIDTEGKISALTIDMQEEPIVFIKL